MKRWIVGVVVAATALAAESNEWAVLATRLNGQDGPELMVLRRESGEILIKVDDVAALGLHMELTGVHQEDGHAWVSLAKVPGIEVSLDPAQQRLVVVADPRLLTRSVRDASDRKRNAEVLGETSAYLNWAVEHTQESRRSGNWGLSGEAGLRLGPVLVHTSAISRNDALGRRTVRLNTSATRDWPEHRTRLVAGDFVLRAPELSGGAQLGGVSYSRVFALDPYEPRRTAPDLRGQLTYPSEVEVYVDGRRVRRERLPAGEFEFQDLYLQEGARTLQLVTRDPFGRVQTLDYSFYASESLLRRGTSEFDYAVGAMRRGYGQRNADYGPLAFSAFHRVGLTPQLTLGGSAQGRAGLLQVGVQGSMAAGAASGLLSWGVAGSRTEAGTGRAASVRYGVQLGKFSVSGSWRQEGPRYTVLSDPLVSSVGRNIISLYGGAGLGAFGSASASLTRQTRQPGRQSGPSDMDLAVLSPGTVRESGSIAWSRRLASPGNWLRLDLTRVRDSQGVHHRIGLLVFIDLEREHRLTVSGNRDPGLLSSALQLERPLVAGEDWGWAVGLDRSVSNAGASSAQNARAYFQAQNFQAQAAWQRSGSSSSETNLVQLAASGGVAILDGRVHWSRPIGDAYALAQVGGLADIPILLNGVSVGQTNGRGELLVPQLSAYYENQLAVDSSEIPIDYAVERIQRRIVLPARTGAVVDFGVTRIRALQGRLVQATTGEPVRSALLRLTLGGRETHSASGSSGDVYLEALAPGRYTGTADATGGSCRFEIDMPDSDEPRVELGDIRCQ